MMKNLSSNFVRMVVAFTFLIFFAPIFSQNTIENNQDKEEDGYLIYFEENTPQSTIDSIMIRYNSYEIWKTKYSNIRYWKVINFPFSIDSNLEINDIDDFIVSASDDNISGNKNDPPIGRCSFNYRIEREIPEYSLIINEDQNSNVCRDIFPSIPVGRNSVLLDILDTGFDFPEYPDQNSTPEIIGGYNYISNNNFANDDNGHGTHITSIINRLCQNSSNQISLFESKTHNSEGIAKMSDIILAIDNSIEMKANIINASWMYYDVEHDYKTPLQIAIEKAGEYGILFVTAAGNNTVNNDNNNLKAFPASYSCENILVVSSNSCDSTLSYFSNYGFESSDICAFGENIPGYVLGAQMAEMSGTSQSTAYVSAIASILGTYFNEFDPLLIKKLILEGAIFNSDLTGLVSSEGVIDVFSSMSLINENIPIEYHSDNSINNNANNKIASIYPVPFNDKITIEIPNNESTTIEIIDALGNIIFRKHMMHEIEEINGLGSLHHGVYIIRTGNDIIKVVKTN